MQQWYRNRGCENMGNPVLSIRRNPLGRPISGKDRPDSSQTDLLVSHCPPFGILDKSAFGANIGNEDLRKQVEIINPRYHLFGHIHEAYGVYKTSRTNFVNGAVVDENYELVNHPVVITT